MLLSVHLAGKEAQGDVIILRKREARVFAGGIFYWTDCMSRIGFGYKLLDTTVPFLWSLGKKQAQQS